MHVPGTPTSKHNTNPNLMNLPASPVVEIQSRKLYSTALKNLFVFFINLVHFSPEFLQPTTNNEQ